MKLVITKQEERILSVLFRDAEALEIRVEDRDDQLRPGDIYRGRVRDVVKNLHAAFIEIRPGVTAYYDMKRGCTLKPGDEITVQVSREAAGTKDAVVTDELTLAGKYAVLTSEYSLGVSSRIVDENRKEDLKALLAPLCGEHDLGFIIRTNAGDAADEAILAEAEQAAARYEELRQRAEHCTLYTRLYTAEQSFLEMIRDSREPLEILTDLPEVFRSTEAFLKTEPGAHTLKLYDDPLLPLSKLYRLDAVLKEATERKIWLRSGGYLVIDPTEAMTVIDVNTGKYDGRSGKEETFLKINTEAADEIARQLRLRNLSGIVVVDYIDMRSEADRNQLYRYFGGLLSRDPVKTVLVDYTKLGLMELTRKKIRKTLKEQLDLGENAC